jgi:hypothetical protein
MVKAAGGLVENAGVKNDYRSTANASPRPAHLHVAGVNEGYACTIIDALLQLKLCEGCEA